MFGQTFDFADLWIITLLVVLEGVLSIDNALVLALLAKPLPEKSRGKALSYGLIGALVFRIIAVGAAAYLLRWTIVKVLGGLYLVYIAIKHLLFPDKAAEHHEAKPRSFWGTVLAIEFMDIAFAVDSILAAIALVGPPPRGTPPDAVHPKLWVVITGGMLGVILMRFAAAIFIKILEHFPRFEMSAYLLVLLIGGKLLVDWWANSPSHPHTINFHDAHKPEFWAFWGAMLLCLLLGFLPKRADKPA